MEYDFPITLTEKKLLDEIFTAKKKFHKSQADLHIEEKIKILIELQKLAKKIQKNNKLIIWEI